MPGLGLRVLTTAVMVAVISPYALAQTGRVGGAAPAIPAPAVAPPPAPTPVVPTVPPPAAPMVHSVAPPAAGHVYSPPAIALPQSHPPSIGAIGTPRLPRQVTAPLGTAHTGRTSAVPRAPSVASHAAGVAATPPVSGRRFRHHRRHGIDAGALWGDPGTCWVWITRPGHRRARLHRCS